MSVQKVEQALSAMREHGERFTEYVNYIFERSDKDALQELATLRQFSLETLKAHKVFYVPKSGASLMVPKFQEHLRSFGVLSDQNKPVFYNRWVFPIFNSKGHVVNLVGYSPYTKDRYLYGRTPYYDRRNTLYGLERLHLVEEMGYALITEGITDTIRLRDMGFPNTYAMCGTGNSTFIYGQINRRASKGVIKIPDRDEPGQRALRNWKFDGSTTLWVDLQYKDIDELCKKHPDGIKAVRKALNHLIGELEFGWLNIDAVTVRVSPLNIERKNL